MRTEMRTLLTALFPLALVALSAPLAAQAAAVNWWQEDPARIAYLKTQGQSHNRPPVVVWAPRDSLDHVWLGSFADSLASAVASLRELIGAHVWQRIASRPINFYLSPGRFISHTDGRDGVFISLANVRLRRGPFLHEAAHELLDPGGEFYPVDYRDSVAARKAAAQFPNWLTEGLPDYLAQVVATKTGFPEGDVFAIGGLTKVDSVCAARLSASKRRDEVLDRVGRSGRLEALFTTERAEVAPVYYACSQVIHQVRGCTGRIAVCCGTVSADS
jgi:hypothetical protein